MFGTAKNSDGTLRDTSHIIWRYSASPKGHLTILEPEKKNGYKTTTKISPSLITICEPKMQFGSKTIVYYKPLNIYNLPLGIG